MNTSALNALKPHHFGHRKRLRERFQFTGSEGFGDYEMLELVLTYAILRKDVKPIAKELIKRFGSLSGVLDADLKELQSVSGMGENSATLIRLIKEIFGRYLAERMQKKDLLNSPQAVSDFARAKLAGLAYEAFMIIYLNNKNQAVYHEIVHEGTIDKAIIYPRRIVERALYHRASGLILVHNHPSGQTQPSEEDKRLTRLIAEATKAIDIRVVDHIIVGKDGNGYFSFVAHQLLEAV